MVNTRPELTLLWERFIQLREECGIKTRPLPERWFEVLDEAEKVGIKADFLNFVLVLCEWWHRVRTPATIHIKRALEYRASLKGYNPILTRLDPMEEKKGRGIPEAISKYVDHHLEKFWDGRNPELSRNVLKLGLEEKIKELARPFRVGPLEPLPPKKGGYGWQAPWATASVIYYTLRKSHPQKNDPLPIGIAELALRATLGKIVTDRRFRTKRDQLIQEFPLLVKNFEAAYYTFLGERAPATALLEYPFSPFNFAVIAFQGKKKVQSKNFSESIDSGESA